jgi:hypothetical protein
VASLSMIDRANMIINEYQAAGYVLTVRQLYYQLVARGIIENTLQSYKNIAGLLNDGRIAGLIDWDAIEDRTRSFITRARWNSGAEILDGCARQFHMDMWHDQERRVFVIVEKEALTGVLEATCRRYDVPLLAARGYPSASVIREFCDTVVIPTVDAGQAVLILHLGDHDPSGLDMSRDLEERIAMFGEHSDFELRRIALNKDQVEEEQPPPNPAKSTDARFANYKRLYGGQSWELDALNPEYLNRLVLKHITREIDPASWAARENEIEGVKTKIKTVAKQF